MKHFNLFVLALAAICLLSCGNGSSVTPTSNKINGPLGDFFEVVERDYKISEDMFNVEFKRVSEGGPTDASFSSEPTFTVELLDEDGNVLCSQRTDVVSTKEQLESVFSLRVGETTSVRFNFETTKGANLFRVSSKWKEEHNNEPMVEEAYEEVGLSLMGMLGGANDAIFTYDYNTDDGDVVFTVNGVKNVRKLKIGSHDKATHKLIMREYFTNGTYVGNFDGTWKDGIYQGIFTNTKGGKVDFKLKETEHLGDLPDVSYDYSNDDVSYSVSSSGSDDWDALLDSYERYVDQYIIYVKKAANGDMSALAEYTSLLQDAQDISSKIQDAQSSMSAAQMERYQRITMKMANAAK